jgi:hypothetical protein
MRDLRQGLEIERLVQLAIDVFDHSMHSTLIFCAAIVRHRRTKAQATCRSDYIIDPRSGQIGAGKCAVSARRDCGRWNAAAANERADVVEQRLPSEHASYDRTWPILSLRERPLQPTQSATRAPFPRRPTPPFLAEPPRSRGSEARRTAAERVRGSGRLTWSSSPQPPARRNHPPEIGRYTVENDPQQKFVALPSGRPTTPAFIAGDRSSASSRHGDRRPVERGAGERSEYLSA